MLYTNIENNLFMLDKIIKTAVIIQHISLDYDLFKDKLFSDVHLVHSCLKECVSFLNDNPHVLDKAEYLNTLLAVEQNFTSLLDTVLQKDRMLTDLFRKEFNEILDIHKHNIDNIRKDISQSDVSEEQEMVSNLEMQLLLTEQGNEEKPRKK